MRIPLDRSGGVPLWRQIERFVRAEIESGALPPGVRIPSSRALALDLGVSRVTVDNAYLALATDGLVVGVPGSGTFVAHRLASTVGAVERPDGWPAWQRRFAATPPSTRADLADPPDAPDQADPPDMIAFTGVGDPTLFPTRDIALTIGDVIRSEGASAFAYGSGELGDAPLRATVTHLLASQGVHTSPDRIVITSGSQQALFLACQALLEPGDTVVVERPTYNVALSLFAALDVRVIGVDVDADGMRVDDIAAAIEAHGAKLIYTIPTFQNPTGACLSVPRRHRLIEIARTCEVPILEDDFVGDLRFDGNSQPAVKALDDRGDVLYAGTFSKMLMPGVRVGYLVADGPVLDRIAALKPVMDLSTSRLMQRVLDRYLTVGRYQTHLRRSVRTYRDRRDLLIDLLRRELPSAAVAVPRGGLFAWVTLPAGVDATVLRAAARQRGVDFAPGTMFYPEPSDGERFARFNFAVHGPDRIRTGVQRLALAVSDVRSGA